MEEAIYLSAWAFPCLKGCRQGNVNFLNNLEKNWTKIFNPKATSSDSSLPCILAKVDEIYCIFLLVLVDAHKVPLGFQHYLKMESKSASENF